jgi:hypothetical protein
MGLAVQYCITALYTERTTYLSIRIYYKTIKNVYIHIFFSFIVFGGTEVPIIYIILCRPSEDSLQGNAIADGSPFKNWQSTVG